MIALVDFYHFVAYILATFRWGTKVNLRFTRAEIVDPDDTTKVASCIILYRLDNASRLFRMKLFDSVVNWAVAQLDPGELFVIQRLDFWLMKRWVAQSSLDWRPVGDGRSVYLRKEPAR